VGLAILTVTNTASDTDLPVNTLTYVLQTGPSNAVIDVNGNHHLDADGGAGASTNLFTTVVNGFNPWRSRAKPSATNSFTVIVQSAALGAAPVIQNVTLSNGVVTLTWSAVAGGHYRCNTNRRPGTIAGAICPTGYG